MKQITDFLKTTLFGGLLVLLPVLLVVLALQEIFGLLVALATPIAALLPSSLLDDVQAINLVAILLLCLCSFLVGLTAKSKTGARFGFWLESSLLGKIPIYKALKNLSSALLSPAQTESFKPALFQAEGETKELAYVIEELADGRLTILIPWAPAAFAGSLKIVAPERIEYLNASLGDLSQTLNQFGIGTAEIMDQGLLKKY